MELKAALATGKKVGLPSVTEGYHTKSEISDLIAEGEISVDDLVSDGWVIEPYITVSLTEADFKEVWDDVATNFTMVKSFDNSKLGQAVLAKLVSGYRV